MKITTLRLEKEKGVRRLQNLHPKNRGSKNKNPQKSQKKS